MAKRKRNNPPAKENVDFSETFDPKASKLQFNSYEDLADSEDEFYINRDKISFEDGPEAKRRRGYKEPDMIELSDEEVLQYEDESSSDGEDDDQPLEPTDQQDSDGEDDINAWGTSREDYYNADKIETEQDALDEEAEALRIQQKRLKSLRAADFGFDPQEWSKSEEDGKKLYETNGDIVTEMLPQMQVTDQMSAAERIDIFKTRYPEVEYLAKDLVELQDSHKELRSLLETPNNHGKVVLNAAKRKYRALSGYLSSIAMYFAILTSTAQTHDTNALALQPQELREHGIMESIVRGRELWIATKEVEDPLPLKHSELNNGHLEEASNRQKLPHKEKEEPVLLKSTRRTGKGDPAAKMLEASRLRREERLNRTEQSLASISTLASVPVVKSTSLKSKPVSNNTKERDDEDSDLGDEQTVTAQEAAEKAQRRKSLRFYTSQIAQKANKRAQAGRAAGGDDDIPYRERLKDRQERLIKAAEKRGNKSKIPGPEADFGDDDSTGEVEKTNLEREYEDDENLLEQRVLAKKDAKRKREEAYQKAKAVGGAVVRHVDDEVGSDGRREVGYVIQKNKGLTPRRKKEVKNPRVKKRKRFEDKSKKLRSMKQVYKGGEGKGGYRGELTGVKSRLVRSVKL